MSVLIGFDTTHGEIGNLKNTYKTLSNLLDQKLVAHKEYPIKQDISYYQIFVIAQPTNFFTPEEINQIIAFVEKGNGLLVLGDNGGDKAHRSNLNDLLNIFGVQFNEDNVVDVKNCLDSEDIVIINKLKSHPIFADKLSEIIYPKGCSLEIISPKFAEPIAWTSDNAVPPNKAVMAISKRKFGRVVISGSFSQFRYDSKGGIDRKSNSTLIKNIINWLMAKEKVQEVKPPTIEFKIPDILKKPQNEDKNVVKEIEKIPIQNEDFKNQINSILEILEVLKGTQKDFGTFKVLQQRFEHLVRMLSMKLNIEFPTKFKQKLAEESTNIAILNKKIRELEQKKESSINLKDYITNQHKLRVISESDFMEKIENINREMKEIDEQIDLLKSKLRIVEGM